MAFLFPCAELFMLPRCPELEGAIRPMPAPQFQPGLCKPGGQSPWDKGPGLGYKMPPRAGPPPAIDCAHAKI